MAIRQVAPLDVAWLMLESRDTPMHVGGLFEFTPPDDAPPDYLSREVERMRSTTQTISEPWSLKLVDGPLVGPRLPLMRDDPAIDLDYHVRHSALPHPGGQRALGVLVSRLHSYQLDLHRPLWEAHVIEGLEGNRFALYTKMHHSLIDGVAGMRMMLRTFSTDPDRRDMPAFWAAPRGKRPSRGGDGAGLAGRAVGTVRGGARAVGGLARAAADLGRAAVDNRSLQAPYRVPDSALGGHLTGQRRFATQQYDLDRLKALAEAGECTLNDIVLYLSGTALRRYLGEHGRLPSRPLTAGIPVNLREEGDESTGTAVGFIVAELATNIASPRERLERIKLSTSEAKDHLRKLPADAQTYYTLLINGPYIAGLAAGLGGRTPQPFSLAISNVPGPTEPLYFNGSRLDAMFPLSLLTHGCALNITCVSSAGTLNFGFTGARDTLPHLQRLAIYMGEAVDEIESILVGPGARAAV